MREALENDMEEDGSPENHQETKSDVVNNLQFCAGRSKSFVEENQSNLDGP